MSRQRNNKLKDVVIGDVENVENPERPENEAIAVRKTGEFLLIGSGHHVDHGKTVDPERSGTRKEAEDSHAGIQSFPSDIKT